MQIHAELILEVPVEHGLLLENLLDLAHAPFTHTSTFAKGWPIPDVVKFNAQKLLGGNWEPYPIDMAFEPPCMVLSTIGVLSYHDDHACPMNMTISGRAVIGTGLGISHICCCTGLKGLYTPLGPLKVHHSCPYFAGG